MLSNHDVLDVCAVMLRRCGMSAAHLAAHMHQGSANSVVAAGPDGPAQPPRATPRQLELLAMANTPAGITVDEICKAKGLQLTTVWTHLAGLQQLHMVTRVKLTGNRAGRFFAQPAHAAAWADEQQAAKKLAASKPAAAPKLAAKVARKAAGRPGAELVAKSSGTVCPPPKAQQALRGEADMSRARVTVAPTPAPRYGVAQGEQLTGGFSTTRPGINPMTGGAW